MKLFIDDLRDAPDDTWTVARNASDAKEFLCGGQVTSVSFDNDLGLESEEGWEIANWLEVRIRAREVPMIQHFNVHSANPPAARRIWNTLNAIAGWQIQSN